MSNSTEPGYVSLTINQTVLETLKKYSLNINQLFILISLYEGAVTLLDIYDEDNTNMKTLVNDYHPLHLHGFIKESTGEQLYELDELGINVVESIKFLFEEPKKENEISIKELALQYLELWPRIKLPSGVYARTTPKEIEGKLNSFFKNYTRMFLKDLGPDGFVLTAKHIMDATKSYLDRYSKQGYQYAMNSSYFIQKKDKSALADEILAIKQGTIKQDKVWEKQI